MTTLNRSSLWYHIPSFGEIEFTPSILAHFEKYQQKRRWHREAGGQLFWEYTQSGHKRVGAITGPRRTDLRTRTSYKADPNKEQTEIDEHYEKGFYLLGDWHTHPEPIAKPSSEDREAIQDIFREGLHNLSLL
ncbi:Mov34/MPN/PAD-1 family protein [Spongiibacter sp.]|uniref:Mov34/MPN/PAD-1 family protein n=1 Tax=Spongiibacter sp. TaxID=2024860 RepID=UPI000C37A6F4|nr:Mov34/MPN/PAD-1 family protein [Spongiibacter sp.]MAY37954.1 hypothetical protein [Spongiibacter sp.]MBI57739.1 hypothetical protein [Spongiibacter sp.]|tara:strand:+ start:264 stop:662 length:399 start_codon:yes stop_codon:yes gene_type:complete